MNWQKSKSFTAEEALEIISDLIANSRARAGCNHIVATDLLADIETIAISYDEMDSELERKHRNLLSCCNFLLDMVNDDRFEGTMTSSVRPSP